MGESLGDIGRQVYEKVMLRVKEEGGEKKERGIKDRRGEEEERRGERRIQEEKDKRKKIVYRNRVNNKGIGTIYKYTHMLSSLIVL